MIVNLYLRTLLRRLCNDHEDVVMQGKDDRGTSVREFVVIMEVRMVMLRITRHK